jgi:hypothetical protein
MKGGRNLRTDVLGTCLSSSPCQNFRTVRLNIIGVIDDLKSITYLQTAQFCTALAERTKPLSVGRTSSRAFLIFLIFLIVQVENFRTVRLNIRGFI